LYLVVHDVTPAFAGVISHLLDVSLRTPAVENSIGVKIGVTLLGEADLSAPISSLVVSEVSQISKFDPHVHLETSLCILTLSGCDQDALDSSGLCGSSVPVVSLKKLDSNKKSLLQMPNQTIKELIEVCSVHSAEAKNLCDSDTEDCCVDLSDTAFLIADCVSILVQALVKSSDIVKTSRTK
jgi:hypothetical protein